MMDQYFRNLAVAETFGDDKGWVRECGSQGYRNRVGRQDANRED